MDTPVPETDRDRGLVALRELTEALQREDARAKADGQLSAFLQTQGFPARIAEYVTDTLGMYTMADLQHPSMADINDELDDLTV